MEAKEEKYMNVQMALAELTNLKREVEEELKDLKDIDYNKNDREEEFLFIQLMEAVADLKEASHSLKYVSKPIAKTGPVQKRGEKIYLDDFELKTGDSIECLVNDYWERKDVFLVNGEIYVEDLTDLIRAGSDQVIGRIRLTPDELSTR